MERATLLSHLAGAIGALTLSHPIRAAIDGVDAAGKTTLANELTQPLEKRGRTVIRASIDGFHRPQTERHRQGADSPEGYYYDSFDYPALVDALLMPLGPGGTRQYRRAIFDFRTDLPIVEPPSVAPADSVLVFDGVFLLRPELRLYWDYCVFVRADFAITVQRASIRDQALFGSPEEATARYWKRYVPGQRLYLAAAEPERYVDAIVENDDPTHPMLLLRDD